MATNYKLQESINPTSAITRSCETGVFECNICFDIAEEPTVTLCGHLFCWPCLYKWLQFHSYSHECPVCKSLVKINNLVPIYGRGTSNSDLRSQSLNINDDIPKRPSGQRPETAPAPNIAYFRQDEFSTQTGFASMAFAKLWDLIMMVLFGAIANGNGVPYTFSDSVNGSYDHGFHQYPDHGHGAKSVFFKICFLFLGLLFMILLISSLPF